MSEQDVVNNATRALPWDSDAEKGALSCFLHQPVELLTDARGCLPRVAEPAEPEVRATGAFYHPGNSLLYGVMLDLLDEGKPVEYIALTNHLRDRGLLEKIGGAGTLSELLNFVPTPAHYGYYKNILQEKLARRKVIQVGMELVNKAYEYDAESDWRELCLEAQGDLFALTQEHGRTRKFVAAAEIMPAVRAHIDEAVKNRGHVTHGLATGFTDLDRTLMGLKPGQLMIIAARPAMGKSALAANIVEAIALANGHYEEFCQARMAVGLVTLEMSGEEILTRMNLGRAGVNLLRAKDGFISKRQTLVDVTKAGVEIEKAPIYILDTGELTIQELGPLAKQAVASLGLSVLVVDYLQLMKSNTRQARGNRYVEVGEVSRGLKALAKALRIPIIAIAQVGRKAEEHKGCRPQMGDLRESGDIENDADIIGLLWREAYYEDCPKDVDEKEWNERAVLILEKNRNGGTGDIPLGWTGELARYWSVTNKLNSNNTTEQQRGKRMVSRRESEEQDDEDPFE